jgi:hypothetical protein
MMGIIKELTGKKCCTGIKKFPEDKKLASERREI